ncbi:tetratricopeptide repeat protein [Clostridium sporogenes]|uniref:Tetratricopeptide repeat protein n=1 Tax=Clostridium sporogenes TaxID=1509 RepID=A0AAE4JU90_CLOSG|nr:tetratricopeptide repeat protein [Clostridium sporogenes]MDS1004926.1 tetratricopeptide repeat protein [Clostridium sporogenes]
MKKISNKIPFAFIFIFTTLLLFVGCAPKGNPEEVLNNYYQNVKDGNVEGAYETLSEQTKKNFTKEDFSRWLDIKKETTTLKETKLEKDNEYKNKELDGIKFKNVMEFKVTEKINNLYDNKDKSLNYKRSVVNDNGNWKVYRGKENGKQLVADSLRELGWLYIEGKGSKTKDLNQAATILNEALKYDKELPGIYYGLAYVYSDLGRYDEAMKQAKLFIEKTKDNKEKSDGYNVLGIIYQYKNQYNEGKKCFDESLKLNPDNQYAKTNLENLKQLNSLN